MKRKHIVSSLLLLICCCRITGQEFQPQCWGDWQTWGMQADRRSYINPILPADFSDIDCIEHDGYYYAISSTFQFEPGMAILRSSDMVHWDIYSHAVSDISQISEAMSYQVMDRYGRGIWAGALRESNGRFYIYFGCPDEGMFMTTATHLKGPWEPLKKMNIPGGWDDCCPYFDEDGSAYLVATHYADNYKTYLFRLMPDKVNVDWNSAVLINEGDGREANKLYKFNGMFYHMYSEYKEGGRYLLMQRAKDIMGPYTEKRRLCHTQRQWNEPNQGGFIKDKNGQFFFLTHHGSGDWGGRQASLLPVTWIDGWPIIGNPDEKGLGNMVWNHPMPQTEHGITNNYSAAKRLFTGFDIADWEWNYHPRKTHFNKTAKKLTLKAFKPLECDNLLKAGNNLTMRSWQTPFNQTVVKLDGTFMAGGQRGGICHFSTDWSEFGLMMQNNQRRIYYRTNKGIEETILENAPAELWLKSSWSLDGICHYAYSLDGKNWIDCEKRYQMKWGNYRGDRLGLFTYNNLEESGEVTFTNFTYECSDKMPIANPFGNSLVPDMIADASIIHHNGTFYCYATTDGYGKGLETSGPPVVWKSKDFVNWSFEDTYFPQAVNEKYWAPSKAVFYRNKWYIYPTVNGYMYPAVADSPEGPFHLLKGDQFVVANRLWEKDKVHAIDTEIFIDDDNTPYAFWGSRHVVRLKTNMMQIDSMYDEIPTRRKEYSEGPIFFKRKGIYYYLYTIGGSESYEYYYQMSRVSPIGPWITPTHDLVCTTDVKTGVYGPGHGSVFHLENKDEYYLAFLEFGRNSTNRMTYVNKLEFNEDGTIRPVQVTLQGVGYLAPNTKGKKHQIKNVHASSIAQRHKIRYFKDNRCQRTEQFVPQFAVDSANGSRWMAKPGDKYPQLTIDLGKVLPISTSEIAFVKPTAGHAYLLEASSDGKSWITIGNHEKLTKRSPHIDNVNAAYRYLRVSIKGGEKGIYEWNIYQ